jgi:hypothetical protein
MVSIIGVEESLIEQHSKLFLKGKRFDLFNKNKKARRGFNEEMAVFAFEPIFE